MIVAGTGFWGTGMNQLGRSIGITVDTYGILYIADGKRNETPIFDFIFHYTLFCDFVEIGRVQRWLPNAIIGDTIVGGLSGTPEHSSITQVLFDDNSNLIALETSKHRIRLYKLATS